jgi:hypothetical protein
MSKSNNLEKLLEDLVGKKFIEESDSNKLKKDLNYFKFFKKKYEFNFESESISNYFDENNNKTKIKNIFVVIGQENLGKTYFIKLLNSSKLSNDKYKKLINNEEIDYQRNKINFKIIGNDYLIARINLNPIFSKSEEDQNKIFEYFKYSNLLFHHASKIFYVTNNKNFNLSDDEYKNEINEQLIYFNFDINENNLNKFIIVKNLFYNSNNINNKNNELKENEIILSSELIKNLEIINSFIKSKFFENKNYNKEKNILLDNIKLKEISNYYLNRFDFSKQLNNCNVDYNYGINHQSRLMFYIEVPEENEYKIVAKCIELDKYVLISIVGEIIINNNKEIENENKKFEIYENIDKKDLKNIFSFEKDGISKQIKEERAYLVNF